MIKLKQYSFILLLSVFFVQLTQAQNLSKYHALYIANFVKYIEWDDGSKDPKIGIVANAETFNKMKPYFANLNTDFLRRIEDPKDYTKCQIIFVPSSQKKLFKDINEATKGKNILVVTEDEQFAKQGASISFYLSEGRLRFILNKAVTDSQRLKVNGKLLSMAKII